MENNFRIRDMTCEDAKVVAEIEKTAFKNGWTENMYLQSLSYPNFYARVLTINGEVCAYLGSIVLGEEVDLTTIAVLEKMRGEGLGRALITDLEQMCIRNNISKINLEVRLSNERAIKFYEKLGFELLGVRKKYYEGEEDARVYRLIIGG